MCKSVADFKAEKSLTTHQTQHTHTRRDARTPYTHCDNNVAMVCSWHKGRWQMSRHSNSCNMSHFSSLCTLNTKRRAEKTARSTRFSFLVWVIIQYSKYTFSHSICAWHRKNLLGYLANCFIHDHGTFSYLNQRFIFVMVHAWVLKFPCQWALRDHYSPASEHCEIKHHTNKMTRHVCNLYIKILLEVNAR